MSVRGLPGLPGTAGPAVKICGLTRGADVAAAIAAGASHLGFVFFPPSPRSITPSAAAGLIPETGPKRVALTVDADDALVDAIARLPIDVLQLHGAETPERVRALRRQTGLEIWKAVGIREPGDLAALDRYDGVADAILVDAKPPEGATRPGGNAIAFDWRLIAGRAWAGPWLLAGGLTPETAAEAVRLTGARALDVSSGVETAPGLKDPGRIRAFVAAARAAIDERDAHGVARGADGRERAGAGGADTPDGPGA